MLPALVIVLFVTGRGAWSRWREVPWAGGAAVYLLAGGSWYAAEAWLHGWAFLSPVFDYYGLHRFLGVVAYQTGPWYFYAPVLVLGAFPWTAFWPAAAAYHGRRLRTDGSLFVVLWCASVVLFYSAAGTKIPNYILPVYPMAAIGVAAWWDEALVSRAGAAVFVVLCATMAATWLSVLTWVAPALEARKPVPFLAAAIHARLGPGDRIVGYRFESASLVYYTDHRVNWASSPADLRAAICAPGRIFLVIDTRRLAAVPRTAPAGLISLAERGGLRGLISLAERGGLRVLLKPSAGRCAPPPG